MHAFQFTVTAAMRFLFLLIFGSFSLSAFAAQPVPGNLEPLPAPPAFTPEPETAPDEEAEITIIKQTELTIEEYRSGGKLYMIKVTPKIGAPYYLTDDRGDGKFARQESLDSGFRPPRWIIHKF
jgi:hypothetical protein